MIGALWNSFWLVPLYAVLMTATVLLGRWLARKEEQKLGTPRQCRVGPFERSVGAMLAFLIGFTFAMSGGDFREAQAIGHRESDAIAEAYRWSHLLAETDRKWLQDNLRVYVDLLIRRDAVSKHGPESESIDREIRYEQAKLWEGLAARRLGATERGSYDACQRAVNQFIQAYDLGYYLDRRRLPDVMVLFILGGPCSSASSSVTRPSYKDATSRSWPACSWSSLPPRYISSGRWTGQVRDGSRPADRT